jgi:hypothetical protein
MPAEPARIDYEELEESFSAEEIGSRHLGLTGTHAKQEGEPCP